MSATGTPTEHLDHVDEPDGEALNVDIGRYLRALRRYGWLVLALVALAITGAVFYTQQQTEVFEAVASVQIEPRAVDVLGQGNDIVAVGGAGLEYYKQQRQVLGSINLLRQTVVAKSLQNRLLSEQERSTLPLDPYQYDLAARRLQKNVAIRYPEQNRIMYVVVRNPDPKLAQEIATQHVLTYEAYSKSLITSGTAQASTALSAEFAVAEKALQDAEGAIYKFQQDNDLLAISLEDKQNLVTSKIVTYNTKFDEAHSRGKELAAKLDILRKIASGGEIVDSPLLAMGDSAAFDAMRALYYTEKAAFEELQKEVGPKTIDYAKAKARVDNLRQTLENEAKRVLGAAEKEYQAAIQFERDMAVEVEKYKQEALALGPVLVKYNVLLRNKKSAEDKYNILVGRLSTSEMTSRMSQGLDTNVRMLDSAQLPTVPVYPKLQTNIMVATALSLLLGLGVVFLIVFFDRSVKSSEDVQASAKAPVVGLVPILADAEVTIGNDRERDLYVHHHPQSQIAEACRSLRTNIVFSGADRQLKTLVVSSANPREGKTTLVMYLGTTMAQSGQRVLIVDTDMRRPRLHTSTGVPGGKGLSNLIVGDEAYEAAIKSTEVPNLFVLPCGPLPPNPAEILMSHKFQVVLAELQQRFDRVILDSPPLGAVTDAVVLSKQADGVVLVVRSGKTLRDEVKRSVRSIRAVGGQVVGVILNQLDTSDRRYGYYRYGGYAYGGDKQARAGAGAGGGTTT
jgi:polysaccharide biosynthesis transport protein